MGQIVALDAPSLGWARAAFARYYRDHHVPPPPDLAEREFAAFPFSLETTMRRHAALPTVEAFERFLRELVPRHVYYSSAYYTYPDHPSMASKEWLGADVIFDLDADHLRNAEGRGYAGQLALVKEQLKRLYDDFLLGDFGVAPADAPIVFSGGRGYHVHVRDERFRSLNSPARRDLVDYLQGAEIDAGSGIVEDRHADAEGTHPKGFHHLSPPETPGWKGRTTRGTRPALVRWESEGAPAAEAEMVVAGMTPKDAKRLAKLLIKEGFSRKIRASHRLDVFKTEIPTELFRIVLKSAAVEVQGETDAPVTTDIHRLIRLPGSLHGGTGFRVVPLERAALDAFNPMRDALLRVAPADRARVTLTAPVDHPFDPPVHGAAGEPLDLATPVALFLVLRGEAELRP